MIEYRIINNNNNSYNIIINNFDNEYNFIIDYFLKNKNCMVYDKNIKNILDSDFLKREPIFDILIDTLNPMNFIIKIDYTQNFYNKIKMLMLEKLHNENLKHKIQIKENNNNFIILDTENKILFSGSYEEIEKEIKATIQKNLNNALLNAKDCIFFGYGRKYWNTCGVSDKLAIEIWKNAIKELEE